MQPLIAAYTATFGSTWRPLTVLKHTADFARFIDYLATSELPLTTASLDFPTLLAYLTDLRPRPKVTGVWRGAPDALEQSRRLHPGATLSFNNGMGLEEVSRLLGHSSTEPTRRHAQQTPAALGLQVADALARAGLV